MYTGTNAEGVRAELKPEAEKGVRSDLVLEAIARQENIDATDEEVTAELGKMAEQYKQDISTIRAALETQGSIDSFKNSISFQKTIQFLVDNAKLV
jgi:trigger factor